MTKHHQAKSAISEATADKWMRFFSSSVEWKDCTDGIVKGQCIS